MEIVFIFFFFLICGLEGRQVHDWTSMVWRRAVDKVLLPLATCHHIARTLPRTGTYCYIAIEKIYSIQYAHDDDDGIIRIGWWHDRCQNFLVSRDPPTDRPVTEASLKQSWRDARGACGGRCPRSHTHLPQQHKKKTKKAPLPFFPSSSSSSSSFCNQVSSKSNSLKEI